MNVRELIEWLQELDPTGELLVVVDGYESGMDELKEPKVIKIGELNHPKPDMGLYEEPDEMDETDRLGELFDAVYMPR